MYFHRTKKEICVLVWIFSNYYHSKEDSSQLELGYSCPLVISKLLEPVTFLIGYYCCTPLPQAPQRFTHHRLGRITLSPEWVMGQKLSFANRTGFGTTVYKGHNLRNTGVSKSSLVRGNKALSADQKPSVFGKQGRQKILFSWLVQDSYFHLTRTLLCIVPVQAL